MTNLGETNQPSDEQSDRPGPRYGQRPRRAPSYGSRPPGQGGGGGYERPSGTQSPGDYPERTTSYGHDKPPPGYGEDGKPPPGYGQDGKPRPTYDDEGKPPPTYDDDGKPAPTYDDEGKPPPTYDDDGKPAPGYGEEGKPPPGNGAGQPGYGPDDTRYPSTGEPEKPAEDGYGWHPCPPSMSACDTGAIDSLRCEAKGVAEESAALASVAEKLEGRRTEFDKARKEYSVARILAAEAVKDLGRTLVNLETDIKCNLTEEEIDCIEKAFRRVRDCLEECDTTYGCCVPADCGFDDEEWTVDRIADLTARVERIEHCFDEELVKEPAELAKRVAHVKELVDKLEEDEKQKNESTAPKDPNRLYARFKEAALALETVWGNFKDVNEYQDCLCCGLTCSLKGRQVLAQLAGDKAFQDCQEGARKKRCDWLLANIVEETLAVLLLVCPPDGPCQAGEESAPTAPA